jgi:two-component system, NarL family, sensor histidine kinase BarA
MAHVSLANKCQLLFGGAVILILVAALAVAFYRMNGMVRESQLEMARQLADSYIQNGFSLRSAPGVPIPMRVVRVEEIAAPSDDDPFLAAALAEFQESDTANERFETVRRSGERVYRYARALRQAEWSRLTDPRYADFAPRTIDPGIANALRAILLIERTSEFASWQSVLNRVYIVVAGLLAGLLAMLVFYLILTKLILSPVRRLRETAELVQKGDVNIRASISTGDEFQQLSEAFNTMLDRLQAGRAQLEAMNQSLDFKINELAEANVGLYESNRLKSEFLANVSHELRTPLNSIIGFAELLEEIARTDAAADPKRVRYIRNILTSGRSLLDMINELLHMAKIEAGRMEISIEPTSLADLLEGLVAIMRPQAEAKQITLHLDAPRDLPRLETDPGKVQQIMYNFLSNAVKFSPVGGGITIQAEASPEAAPAVRLSVIDRGPGIPADMQDMIFEKFRQVDASHTKQHGGTGLGLAICKELADMLGGAVGVHSRPGEGSTFWVDLPLVYRPRELAPLMA